MFFRGWDDKNIRFSILILGVFKDQTLMTFVRVWASANAWFPYSLFLSYLLVMFSSCIRVVFAWLWWQQHTFLDAETSLFLIVQGPNFDELCACLSQCTFIHCVNSMILICYPWCIHSELGLNYVFLVHLWWQFVYQMMLVDACFLCFLGSSNRSSCSGPHHRTVLNEDISMALQKKNPLCQNECLNLLNRSRLFWSTSPVLYYCHVMVINTIIAVLNYQISTSKIAMESNLFLALNCHTWIYMLVLTVIKNLFRTLHDWSWNMWSKSYQIPCQVITKWMAMWLQMTVG